MAYTPPTRRLDNEELAELRQGAATLRARAQRTTDPAQAERDSRAAARNDADIKAEMERRCG